MRLRRRAGAKDSFLTCTFVNYRQKRLLILMTAKGSMLRSPQMCCTTGYGVDETRLDNNHTVNTEKEI